MTIRYAIFLICLIVLIAYTYTSVRILSSYWWVRACYMAMSVIVCLGLMLFFSYEQSLRLKIEESQWIATLFFLCIGFLIMQLLWTAILVVDDVRGILVFGFQKIISLLRPTTQQHTANAEVVFSRSAFLQWLGFSFGALVFGAMIWGLGNKYNYKKHRVSLKINGLSDAWKGFKIVQISDIHSGSFHINDQSKIQKGIDAINAERPDIILFTGDLVNNAAREFEKWTSTFSQLRAPLGIYSILGNHDYGDYYQWETYEAKKANLEHLKDLQRQMGWHLLDNKAVHLHPAGIQDKLALVGVENWSAKSQFPKYGRLNDALAGLDEGTIKILMSHDPSHWEAEVLQKHPSIKLTLSGHTHGMQFGLETPFVRWSPVQWVYKQWAGLYQQYDQYLYVNRGWGFLGYPGRVGIMPEITIIELV